jgi:hypothetical protein
MVPIECRCSSSTVGHILRLTILHSPANRPHFFAAPAGTLELAGLVREEVEKGKPCLLVLVPDDEKDQFLAQFQQQPIAWTPNEPQQAPPAPAPNRTGSG